MRFFRLRPMALGGVAFFLCSVLATYLDRLWAIALGSAALVVFFALVAVFALRPAGDKDRKQSRLAILSLLLAPALAFSLAAFRSFRDEAQIPVGEDVRAVCVVRSRSDASSGSARYMLAVRSVDGKNASFTASALWHDRSFVPGDVIEAKVSFEPVDSAYPSGARSLRALGAVAEAELTSVRPAGTDYSPLSALGLLRERIAARIARDMGENAPLVTALVTGDRSDLDPAVRRAFSKLGVAHLLALSGVHMSVIAGAVSLIAGPKGRRRYYAVIPAVLLYAAISGFAASAVRAAAMIVICCLAGIFGRRTDPFSVVALAAALIILLSPGAAWDVGFLLSVLSVLALAALGRDRFLAADGVSPLRKALRFVLSSVAATVAVSVVTLPVTAREFGMISLAAPAANIIFIPLVTLILYAAPVYLCATFVPYLGTAIGAALDFYCTLVVRLARWMSSFGAVTSLDRPGFAILSVVLCLFFFAALVAKNKRFPAACAAVTAAAMVLCGAIFEIGRANEIGVSAHALGAGDLIALTDGSSLYIVDCARGNTSFVRDVDAVRRQNAATRIEKYVFTHCHEDSDVYLRRLLASEEVGTVVLPSPRSNGERRICMQMAKIALDAGATPELTDGAIPLGDAALEVRTVCDTISGVDPVFTATVRHGDRSVRYVSANSLAASVPDDLLLSGGSQGDAAETTVIGTHPAAGVPEVGEIAVPLSPEEAFRVVWEK